MEKGQVIETCATQCYGTVVLNLYTFSVAPYTEYEIKKNMLFHSLWQTFPACGLYYKHVMIANDDSSIVNKFGASLTDDAKVIIYNHCVYVKGTGQTFVDSAPFSGTSLG